MKNNKFIKCITLLVAIVLIIGLVGCTESPSSNSENSSETTYDETVMIVREATFYWGSNVTYGEAFDNFFGNCKWEAIPMDSLGHFCKFTGDCTRNGEDITCEFKFIRDYDGEVTVDIMSIDGVEQEYTTTEALLERVHEKYIEEHGNESSVDAEKVDTETNEELLWKQEGYQFNVLDYTVTDYGKLNAVDSIDEFISLWYSSIIDDYVLDGGEVEVDGYDIYCITIELYMSDDFGWDNNDYYLLAFDMMKVLEICEDFYNPGAISFILPDGTEYQYWFEDDFVHYM